MDEEKKAVGKKRKTPQNKLETNYEKADSLNIPKVNTEMVIEFFSKAKGFITNETSGAKLERSMRGDYGDNAIGWVQLHRRDNVCIVKGMVTPEHKIKQSAYPCVVIVNEGDEEVTKCACYGCAAAAGGCKHAAALLMWLHRQSDAKSVTSQECYWKKSALSSVGGKILRLTTEEHQLTEAERQTANSIFNDFLDLQKEKNVDNKLLTYFRPEIDEKLKASMHNLSAEINSSMTPEAFLKKCGEIMDACPLQTIEEKSREQAKSEIWTELRYGRITASIIHQAAHCGTLDGYLVKSILGKAKELKSRAVLRGKNLEKEVIAALAKSLGKEISECGLLLDATYPALGASPDGISDDFVVEVKCPSSTKTKVNFIKENGEISAKFMGQIQLQMHFAKKEQGLFCVADPDFENNKQIELIVVEKHEEYIGMMIERAMDFWNRAIFPRLKKIRLADSQ